MLVVICMCKQVYYYNDGHIGPSLPLVVWGSVRGTLTPAGGGM